MIVTLGLLGETVEELKLRVERLECELLELRKDRPTRNYPRFATVEEQAMMDAAKPSDIIPVERP